MTNEIDDKITDQLFDAGMAVTSGGIALITKIVRDAVAAEREACAKACDDVQDWYCDHERHKYPEMKTDAESGARECGWDIRERGNANEKAQETKQPGAGGSSDAEVPDAGGAEQEED